MTVSLVVPVYNVKEYLTEFLDSVAAQTFDDFETVFVDDGSTDGSGEMLDAFASRFHDCKVIHKENGGVASAWKRGATEASGEYLAFADPDDVMHPEMLQTQYSLMKENNADLLITGIERLQDGVKKSMSVQFFGITEGVYEGERLEFIKRNLFGSKEYPRAGLRFFKQNKMFKRDSVIAALDYTDERIAYGDDICMAAAAVYDSRRLYYSPKVLYTYRIRNNSLTTATFKPEEADNSKLLLEKVIELATDKGYMNDHILYGYPAYRIVGLVKNICRSGESKKQKKAHLEFLRNHPYVREFSVKLAKKHLTRRKLNVIRLLKMRLYSLLIMFLKNSPL